MTAKLPLPRLPTAPPSPRDLDERDRYATLTSESLATVRKSAQTWRNGLAAFITLVTTGVVIKGRDNTAALTVGWKIAVTLLIGGGLALAVVGLWQALVAEAGTGIQVQTLEEIRADYLTLDAYQVSLAIKAANRLQSGRYVVVGALVCLMAGVVVTWWAPANVTGKKTICGTLQAGGQGTVSPVPISAEHPTSVPFSGSGSLTLTTPCQ
jgi:hypothetical protein